MMCCRLNVVGTTLLALVATIGVANAQVNLVPNGDFETAGGDSWVFAGPAVSTYPASGGNPGGYGSMDSSAGWGVFVSEVDPANGLSLASLGLTAGGTYDITMDMIGVQGGELAGIKLESWAGGAHLSNSGDLKETLTDTWSTYTWSYTVDPAATSVKFVPLSVDGGAVGFDNVGVVVPEPASIGLLSLAGLMIATRRRRK
ncbi:MAG: PEP-CTERM sorting domain-containing protein [Pirellulales bacterium]